MFAASGIAVRLIVTAPLTLLLSGCASIAPTRELRVGIVGDQTVTSNTADAYGVLEKAVARLKAERVRVVLHTGDLVESCDPPSVVREAYQRASGILDGLAVPWYLAAGDHDVGPRQHGCPSAGDVRLPAFVQDSPDRTREALFQELYGTTRPEANHRLYYSFDVDGYHFVALYSSEALNADPRWGAILLAHLSRTQIDWLAADLAQHRDATATVVFLHQPLWYNWTSWVEVHRILRQHRVSAVIAGHFHYNQDDGTLDGIRYVVVGAAGGRVKTGAPRAGNLQHVTVMTLHDRDVEFTVLPLDGGAPTTLTPRADMDRVQMLDVALGSGWDFEAKNPVFLKHGTLVASCDSAAPARLEIPSLGNPLDTLLIVTVKLQKIGVGGPDPTVDESVCRTRLDATHCLLRGGAHIGIANLSSVEVASGRPPLWAWTAPPQRLAGGPTPGTAFHVDIHASFQGTSGPLFLERRLTTTVRACP